MKARVSSCISKDETIKQVPRRNIFLRAEKYAKHSVDRASFRVSRSLFPSPDRLLLLRKQLRSLIRSFPAVSQGRHSAGEAPGGPPQEAGESPTWRCQRGDLTAIRGSRCGWNWLCGFRGIELRAIPPRLFDHLPAQIAVGLCALDQRGEDHVLGAVGVGFEG